jgi:acetyl-CoA acetyltransferase
VGSSIDGRAAIAGIGATPFTRRGGSAPRTKTELAIAAILDAVADAGLHVADIDGFAGHSGGLDPALLAQALGIPEVRFAATVTGGGGGSAGSVGLAAAAIAAGMAEVVVTVTALRQGNQRLGAAFAPGPDASADDHYAHVPTAAGDFLSTAGLVGPPQLFSMLARRHMHRYGTTREHFAEVVLSTRDNATRRPSALMRKRLTRADYFASRMITDTLCLLDCCLESDGAVAIVTTSAERAADLRRRPAYVMAAAQGGAGRWGQAIEWLGMPDGYFASSGHRPVATRLYGEAGVGPSDVDVALLYDHFSPMVLLQLEDYGLCPVGESGPFVATGAIRWPAGRIPVNPHGGHLSEAYLAGMTHLKEAVEQLRGDAVNQVDGAEVALVTGGPGPLPVSSVLLRR